MCKGTLFWMKVFYIVNVLFFTSVEWPFCFSKVLKLRLLLLKTILEKRRFIESFFINSTPNVTNEKSSDLFPNIYKATFGCDWLDMVLCFDPFFRLNAQFVFIAVILSPFYILLIVVFYLAVISFRFICSPLSNVPLQRNLCYHYVIQSHAFSGFQCSPARVAIYPDESLLSVGWNVGVVFTFTTVKRRLLLLFRLFCLMGLFVHSAILSLENDRYLHCSWLPWELNKCANHFSHLLKMTTSTLRNS